MTEKYGRTFEKDRICNAADGRYPAETDSEGLYHGIF